LVDSSDRYLCYNVRDLHLYMHGDVLRTVHMRFEVDVRAHVYLLKLRGGIGYRARRRDSRVQRSRNIRNLLPNLERCRTSVRSAQLGTLQNARASIVQESVNDRAWQADRPIGGG